MMGLDAPGPGSSSFQLTFSVGLQLTGVALEPVAMPVPFGPRKRGHSASQRLGNKRDATQHNLVRVLILIGLTRGCWLKGSAGRERISQRSQERKDILSQHQKATTVPWSTGLMGSGERQEVWGCCFPQRTEFEWESPAMSAAGLYNSNHWEYMAPEDPLSLKHHTKRSLHGS